MQSITNMIPPIRAASISLEEAAGASILQRSKVSVVGQHFVTCGEALELLSMKVKALDPESSECTLSAQRMAYASEQMIVAGKELMGEKKEKPKGKSWIKGSWWFVTREIFESLHSVKLLHQTRNIICLNNYNLHNTTKTASRHVLPNNNELRNRSRLLNQSVSQVLSLTSSEKTIDTFNWSYHSLSRFQFSACACL